MFIAEYIDTHTTAPVVREISQHFAITIKGAQNHVAAIRRKGYLTYEPRLWRSIVILKLKQE
jgi:repressor LexA